MIDVMIFSGRWNCLYVEFMLCEYLKLCRELAAGESIIQSLWNRQNILMIIVSLIVTTQSFFNSKSASLNLSIRHSFLPLARCWKSCFRCAIQRRNLRVHRHVEVVVVHVLHNMILATQLATTHNPRGWHKTYPVLTLMRNSPPINRKPPPILLRPRPLHRHISTTSNCLPQVIETVV